MADLHKTSKGSNKSGLTKSSSTSSFSDVGVTPSGDRVRFRIKDFKSKIYDKSFVVPKDFEAKVGVHIAPNLVIHKFLAGGYQGGVYMVADADGNVDNTRLLKILKKSAVLGDLEKEWAIGLALNVLSNEDGHLVGFMKTFEAIRVEGEEGIRGMLIERLNGRLVEDVVADHKFASPEYLRDLLHQVFLALSRAYTVLGFKHADLRLTNVMEHYPDPNNPEVREFKIIDFGLASIQERVDSKLFQRLQKAVFNKLTNADAMAKLFVRSINPAHHFSLLSEAVYKLAWIRHNDVYHILASLSHYTDDRTWPEEQRQMVEQYAQLMRDVTGIKLRLKYLPSRELEARKALKETEVKKAVYKVHNAFAGFKHFNQRIRSQVSQRHKSNICPMSALRYPLFEGLVVPQVDGVTIDNASLPCNCTAKLCGMRSSSLKGSDSGSELDLASLNLGDAEAYVSPEEEKEMQQEEEQLAAQAVAAQDDVAADGEQQEDQGQQEGREQQEKKQLEEKQQGSAANGGGASNGEASHHGKQCTAAAVAAVVVADEMRKQKECSGMSCANAYRCLYCH